MIRRGRKVMVEQPERYCSNCGHQLRPEGRFCSNCGMPVHRGARVPTPRAHRPVSPPSPPPQRAFGKRKSTLSDALRGRWREPLVVSVLVGLFLFVVLPVVLESLIAGRLQTAFGAPTKPEVQISSSFPPELLWGRLDRIQVRMEQANLQGVAVYDAQADLKDAKVSVPSLLEGDPTIEAQGCSIKAETPPLSIMQNEACLGYLGLGAGY